MRIVVVYEREAVSGPAAAKVRGFYLPQLLAVFPNTTLTDANFIACTSYLYVVKVGRAVNLVKRFKMVGYDSECLIKSMSV